MGGREYVPPFGSEPVAVPDPEPAPDQAPDPAPGPDPDTKGRKG